MDNNRETVWGVILSYVSIGVNVISTLIFIPFLIRSWGQGEYGLYQLIGTVAGYLSVMDFGLSTTVVRYTAKLRLDSSTSPDDKARAQSNLAGMFAVIYGVIALLAAVAAAVIYFSIDTVFAGRLTAQELALAKPMFIMLAASMVITVFGNLFTGMLSAMERFVFQRAAAIIKGVFNIVLGMLIVGKGAGSVELTALNTAFTVLFFFSVMLYTLRVSNIKIRLYRFDFTLARELLGFSVFIFLQSLMAQLYYKIDETILGVYMGTSTVAVYSSGVYIFNMYYLITSAINGVVMPKAVRLAEGGVDGRRITDFMVRVSRAILSVYALFAVGFAFLGRDFIRIWVGDGFEQAYGVALILILASLIPRIQASANDILRAFNKHAFLTVMYLAMAVANVVATVIAVPVWGMAGAAASTAGALILGNVIFANWYFRRVLKLEVGRFFIKSFSGIWIAVAAACAAGALLSLWQIENMAAALAVKACVIGAVYAAVMLVCGWNRAERMRIAAFLGKREKHGG